MLRLTDPKVGMLKTSLLPKRTLQLIQASFANVNLMKPKFLGKYLLKNVPLFVHNVLMAGSPGSGKSLLARAMPGILPEMSIDESLDVTRIYSVADQLPAGMLLIRHRPFCSRIIRFLTRVWWAVGIFRSLGKSRSLTGASCSWMSSPNSARASSK
jgi:energy-coupling factor transporter ATP-binding protein EcfA2